MDAKYRDPIMHYLHKGGFEGRDPGPDFNSSWYLDTYKDVKKANFNPLVHFLIYGSREGRAPNKEALTRNILESTSWHKVAAIVKKPPVEWKSYFIKGRSRIKPKYPTLIIVSHEGSLTGAPLLCLNLAQKLSTRYNIISILQRGGDLLELFQETSSVVIAPPTHGLFNYSFLEPIIEELLKKYSVEFAIVNSVESRGFLKPLSSRFIPTIHLIHEFAAYTQPKYAFFEAALWSHIMIFSTEMTYENAIMIHPELMEKKVQILPQGKCEIPELPENIQALKRGDTAFLKLMDSFATEPNTIIVLGVGFVQIRKGVDLFIACAEKVANEHKNVKFLWIGDGYDPENDMNFSAYIAEQIHRSSVENSFFLLESMSDIEKAYQAADMLLLSSRLDPLPNVAIDAMFHKIPVLCFDRATGIANILRNHGLQEICVAPYMDINSISLKIERLIFSESLRKDVGERCHSIAKDVFNMEEYVRELASIGISMGRRVRQEKEDLKIVEDSGLARMDFFLSPHIPLSHAYIHYIQSWVTGIARRKLFPGFHPGIYLDHHPQIENKIDPLVDYISNKYPDGPWNYPLITEQNHADIKINPGKVGLHIHAYYPELLPEIIDRLNQNEFHPDLLISIPEHFEVRKIAKILHNYQGQIADISSVPNQGRDLGPFFTHFSQQIVNDYEIIGHFHTKNTSVLDNLDLNLWRKFLLENLIGGKSKMSDIILANMVSDSSIGMVFPDEPNIVGWGTNYEISQSLASKLGIDQLPRHFNFPVGSMFWARVDAVRPLFDLNLSYMDYPEEPIKHDGTILHAIERLLPFVSNRAGFKNILTNVKGISR